VAEATGEGQPRFSVPQMSKLQSPIDIGLQNIHGMHIDSGNLHVASFSIY
jgi:hypothetical protein